MASPSPSPSPSPSSPPPRSPVPGRADEDLGLRPPTVDAPLSTWLAVLGVVVFAAAAGLSAAIEVLLVPVRVGTTIVPVSVALAVLSNVGIPMLSRRAVPRTVAGVVPAAAWIVTVLGLSEARPEGDVLLVGSPSPLAYVTYALLGVGILTATLTVVRGHARAVEAQPS